MYSQLFVNKQHSSAPHRTEYLKRGKTVHRSEELTYTESDNQMYRMSKKS